MSVNLKRVGQCRPGRRCAGYTLVEVLCSIFIAAIATAALFAGFNNSFAILRTTREDLRATQILMQKTEAVRLLTWQQLTNVQNKEPTFKEYYYPAGASTNQEGTLYWGTISTTASASNLPDTVPYKANLHLVTITVAWTNYVGAKPMAHFREMQTLSALSGMQSYLSGGTNNY